MSARMANRTMGHFPLSIATSLALEGLYNIHPTKQKERVIPANKGKQIWFNIRTLFRNIYGSLVSEEANESKAREYVETIIYEIEMIEDILNDQAPSLKAFFYLPSYESLAKEYKNGELRQPKTPNQIFKHNLEQAVYKSLFDHFTNQPKSNVRITDLSIKSDIKVDSFVVTHYPVDLLNLENFGSVYLLESHTGILKEKGEWNSKLSGSGNERIPFNKAMLLFFGDSGNMFAPQPLKARKRLQDIASRNKWNPFTTKDRILFTIKQSMEGQLESVLKALWN